jgi:hypothetical protein
MIMRHEKGGNAHWTLLRAIPLIQVVMAAEGGCCFTAIGTAMNISANLDQHPNRTNMKRNYAHFSTKLAETASGMVYT